MSDSNRLVIAVSDALLDEFVGPDQLARLDAAYGGHTRLAPDPAAPADRWRDALVALAPRAILTGWGTPPLPPHAVPPLAIVGHTAGSVRGLVDRSMVERGLAVVNWGGAAAPSVAEAALMLTLSSLRRLGRWTAVMKVEGGWKGPNVADGGASLYGKRVGLHGLGRVARHFVNLIAPFGCEVSAFSAGVPASAYAAAGVRAAPSLESLFRDVDVLVECEALNEQTQGTVTESLLRQLPVGGVFVNVGRGAVVDEAGLVRLAQEGRLLIGLDVYAREPLPADSPLRALPNVILTPHVAGPTRDHRRACGTPAVAALLQFAREGHVEGAISLDDFDRST